MIRTETMRRWQNRAGDLRSGVGSRGLAGLILTGILAVAAGRMDPCHGGELIIDGSLTVKTNLVIEGQLSGTTLVLTNLAVTGQATLQEAVILRLPPQGDLAMGPYTNRTDR